MIDFKIYERDRIMPDDMNATPRSSRFTIGLFGVRNAGKSSLINALTGQNLTITSPVAGTTTDPVSKSMELLPIGPVVFIDTAGLDDTGDLGSLRVEKTYETLRKCNLAVVVADLGQGITDFEKNFINELKARKIPAVLTVNKCDSGRPPEEVRNKLIAEAGIPTAFASAATGFGIGDVKELIIKNASYEEAELSLIGDLVHPGETAVLVVPIDKAAPKGRLILPQQQTIRDLLENDASAIVTKPQELKLTLANLSQPPVIVITDSQAFLKVSADTPPEIPMTSFSILFARQKGNLTELVRGIRRIHDLKPGEKVLIMEGCTHHRQSDDIGTVKIPRWIRQMAGSEIEFEWCSGASIPKNLKEYAVIVHCGACMLNRREMQYRIETAGREGVAITNYGMVIAYVLGILPRALKPFPAAAYELEKVLRRE